MDGLATSGSRLQPGKERGKNGISSGALVASTAPDFSERSPFPHWLRSPAPSRHCGRREWRGKIRHGFVFPGIENDSKALEVFQTLAHQLPDKGAVLPDTGGKNQHIQAAHDRGVSPDILLDAVTERPDGAVGEPVSCLLAARISRISLLPISARPSSPPPELRIWSISCGTFAFGPRKGTMAVQVPAPVPMIKPSRGVKPMLVSTLLPCPPASCWIRCPVAGDDSQRLDGLLAEPGDLVATYLWLIPWNPYRRI